MTTGILEHGRRDTAMSRGAPVRSDTTFSRQEPPAGASGTPGPLDNVDAAEVARYSALAATWWDPTGPFWPLHRLNALRSVYLRDRLCEAFDRDAHASRPLAGLELLDVGCGGGILGESMARLGAHVHGIDVVERNIAIARSHAAGEGLPVRYELTTAGALADTGVRYDAVLNMEVVEHVPDVAAFMADCARLVRPRGLMSVATINRTALSWLFAIVGAEYVLRWLPRGTHQWRRFVRPAELHALLDRHGHSVTASVGVRVNPVTRAFSLQRSLAVNYMLIARARGEG
jgi:2-polyprenyl-6-hydroxyphenyl methylase/3-demethylubiquinone-9 3-methyltransferase